MTIRATVEKLVFGGKGLIRHEGLVIFVADVLPQEEVVVEIITTKKSYAEARLVEVITPSPDRVKAPCPYFGTCGGCQLQHVAYPEQLKAKKEWLIEALERIGKILIDFPIETTQAKKEWGYRRKVVLHGAEGGFYARDNVTIIPIDRCLLYSTTEDLPRRPGAVMRTGGCETIEGLKISYSSDVFIQNDPEQSLQIYQDVLDSMDEGPILDLYCGIGCLTLLAAKRGHQMFGVELNAKAIEYAKENAKANGIDNARFVAKPCEKVTKKEVAGFEQWIVNPPRVGLSKEVLNVIVAQKPQKVVYISCMPSTLARDCKVLYENGYRIEKAHVYDMFAQTSHLETVVYLKRD